MDDVFREILRRCVVFHDATSIPKRRHPHNLVDRQRENTIKAEELVMMEGFVASMCEVDMEGQYLLSCVSFDGVGKILFFALEANFYGRSKRDSIAEFSRVSSVICVILFFPSCQPHCSPS